MFDSLKKKLKSSAERLAEKVKGKEEAEKPEERPKKKAEPRKRAKPDKKLKEARPKRKPKEEKPSEEEPIEEAPAEEAPAEELPEEPKGKLGLRGRISRRITERKFSEKDLDSFFAETESELLQANVGLEVIDALKARLKEELAGKDIKRTKATEVITKAFEESLFSIVNQDGLSLEKTLKEKRPACFVFLGFNGSGKTTTIAKVAKYLMGKDYKPVLAAADTFRAASIEQLEHHGGKLGLQTIKHQYGSDSAAVVFDAKRHAEAKGLDAVLADTAGRSHANANLMDELKKIIRVNKPDMKILIVDSLTGNDAVEQAQRFHEAVGVDAVILTKVDVNKKGGSILSVAWAIKKPILFLGMGQEYGDIEPFDPKRFVKELLE
jgi:fused signal recognition particle receptor